MRLFRRGRTHRAPATVISVSTNDRLEECCVIDVQPPLAPRFESILCTRLEIEPNAHTFVLYDPKHREECVLDDERLRASGAEEGRAYTYVGTGLPPVATRAHVTLADAAERLHALDRLNEMRRRGEISEEDLAAERRRVLAR